VKIEFGWEVPTGKRRMPNEPTQYKPHLERILNLISGHFHSAWIPDHFMDSEHNDYPESLVTISHMAALYSRLFFGPIVLGQNYRNPALLAKMAATIQQLTGGRFVLGIGAGWHKEEYKAYGYPFPNAATRIAQLGEAVQICKAMWNPEQPTATFLGQHYQIENAVCAPKPSPAPPVMIGGGGEKLTLRVVAQHADWWNLVGVSAETYAHKIEVLRRHCAQVGRNPAQIRKTWMGVVSIAPTRRQAQAAMEGYPIWPEDIPIVGTPAEVIDQLHAYTALGVDLFILGFAGEPDPTALELFIEKVIPAV